MKKGFLFIFSCIMAISLINSNSTFATSANHITPKAPVVNKALKPSIAQYRQGNYVGAMLELEDYIRNHKKEDLSLAKYYLALCYTRLGYRQEAQILYNEVSDKKSNLTLTYYSNRAITCLDNPENELCKIGGEKNLEEEAVEKEEIDDITEFIRSGKKIHPAAMDKITKERMERKLQEDEYIRSQKEQEANGMLQSKSEAPTNEEIAFAINTLSKIGINPFMQNQMAYNNNLQSMPYDKLNPMMLLNSNIGAYNKNNSEMTKMLMMNALSNGQNNLMDYGI